MTKMADDALTRKDAEMERLAELLKRLESTPDVVRLNSFRPEILGDFTVGDLRRALSLESVREEAKDQAYLERNYLVATLARLYPSGIRKTNIPGWSDDWHGCCFIDLPSGQISYHFHDSQAHLFADLPAYTKEWDGHDKNIVHTRLRALHSPARVAEARSDLVQVSRTFLESLICPMCDGSGWINSTGPDPVHDGCPWCEARDRFLAGDIPSSPESPAKEQPGERREGKYRLVYNKVTKKIDKIRNFDGLAVESFDPPTDCDFTLPPPPERP